MELTPKFVSLSWYWFLLGQCIPPYCTCILNWMWIVWETAHSTRQNTNSLQFVIVFHNEEMEGKHLMILALAVALPCSRVIDSHCCYKMPASITLKARIPTVNLFTPWSRVLLDKVTGSQLVKKYPAFYGTRRFITAFTSAHRLSLSWVLNIMIMISGSLSPRHRVADGGTASNMVGTCEHIE